MTDLIAQNKNNAFFSPGYDIVIDILPENDFYFGCIIEQGMSVYHLSRVFEVDLESIYSLNNLDPMQTINQGEVIKVPIDKNKVIFNPNFRTDIHPHISLYYKVKKGETLYRIAKEYLNADTESLLKINRKQTPELKDGEKLLVGWLLLNDNKKPGTKLAENTKAVKIVPVLKPKEMFVTINDIPEKEVKVKETVVPTKIKWITSNVIAMWDRKNYVIKSLFVLHNEARIGSSMDIYFPMLKKHVKAKVLGRIPEGTYKEDINLFVSPGVARELGIRDARFMVNIKYEM
ncbi:MAG: LysM peptidoglycan-binding domain-containing protein [Saprospiraceae bacterium]|nr:LysM peptidoglycan-binding domain-containing protein [Saprospiraceae bacterium]